MKDASFPTYTVTWSSGHCRGPGVTTLQPRTQLAATTEVCIDDVLTFGSLGPESFHGE
jgi:hypothetical protein